MYKQHFVEGQGGAYLNTNTVGSLIYGNMRYLFMQKQILEPYA